MINKFAKTDILIIKDVAKRTICHSATANKIPMFNAGSIWRFSIADIDDFIDRQIIALIMVDKVVAKTGVSE